MNSQLQQIKSRVSAGAMKPSDSASNFSLRKYLAQKLAGLVRSRTVAFEKVPASGSKLKSLEALRPMATSGMDFTIEGICRVIVKHERHIMNILPRSPRFVKMREEWIAIIEFAHIQLNPNYYD